MRIKNILAIILILISIFIMTACGNKSVDPEVVSVTENDDGTITLLVEAVWPKYRDDKAYIHEVTVRPAGDNFKYVSNRIVEKKMDTKWYVGR